MSKYPSGLNIIEAMVPQLSRFAVETKTDYFTVMEAAVRLERFYGSQLYKDITDRQRLFCEHYFPLS